MRCINALFSFDAIEYMASLVLILGESDDGYKSSFGLLCCLTADFELGSRPCFSCLR